MRRYTHSMKKAAFIVLGVMIASIAGCLLLRQPSRYKQMSEAEIHSELLKDVPLGSSSDRVRSYLRRKTGRDAHYSREFYGHDPNNPNTIVIVAGKPLPPGIRYYAGLANATLANYGPPLSSAFRHGPFVLLVSTNVQTRWEFDARDKLIDLRVTKQPFGP
jgi:hypothetical protein